jgi:predicted RNA binding protein YcfA (HicA-like mRNA interferase family)
MSRLAPVSRRDLIQRLRYIGFEGPFSGGRHEFMMRGTRRLTLPNPHRGEISTDLLSRLLRQVEVTREEWESSDRD